MLPALPKPHRASEHLRSVRPTRVHLTRMRNCGRGRIRARGMTPHRKKHMRLREGICTLLALGPSSHEALGHIHSQSIHHRHHYRRRQSQVAISNQSPRPHREVEYEHHWKYAQHGASRPVRIDETDVVLFQGEVGQRDPDEIAGETEEEAEVVLYRVADSDAEDGEERLDAEKVL